MVCEVRIDTAWLHERGGLHDAKITNFDQRDDEVSISIEDEWIDHEGYPDYKGPSAGKIIARGIKHLPASHKLTSDWIMDAVFEVDPVRLRIELNDGSEIVLEALSFWWLPTQ